MKILACIKLLLLMAILAIAALVENISGRTLLLIKVVDHGLVVVQVLVDVVEVVAASDGVGQEQRLS